MAKKVKTISEGDLKARVEYYEKNDKHGKVYMPNDIFELLSTNDELMSKQSPDMAVAYTYTYLITWLWRNAKYGQMENENTDVGAIKEMLGYTSTNKTLDYIVKKGGVTDKLGLTQTLNYKEAPINYEMDGSVPTFFTQEDLDEHMNPEALEEAKQYRPNNKRKTVKMPVFSLYDTDGEYGQGTFGGNIENTHEIDFNVFIQCMTNPNLGCKAFYLYGFLKFKGEVSGGSTEIGGATITNKTGLRHGSREEALDGLKKHNLIQCFPADYYVGAGKGDGANVYIANDWYKYREETSGYAKRRILPKKHIEEKEKLMEDIDNFWK